MTDPVEAGRHGTTNGQRTRQRTNIFALEIGHPMIDDRLKIDSVEIEVARGVVVGCGGSTVIINGDGSTRVERGQIDIPGG